MQRYYDQLLKEPSGGNARTTQVSSVPLYGRMIIVVTDPKLLVVLFNLHGKTGCQPSGSMQTPRQKYGNTTDHGNANALMGQDADFEWEDLVVDGSTAIVDTIYAQLEQLATQQLKR